jgi:hypothetical protein
MPWVGRPARRPDVKVEYLKGRHLVYASWNGATELAHWRVATSRETTTHARTGFETLIVSPPGAKSLSLTPLDAKGAPLHSALELKV